MLEHTGRWLEKGEFIETAAPYRRKLSTWTYFYAQIIELRELLNDRQVWAPSLFDSERLSDSLISYLGRKLTLVWQLLRVVVRLRRSMAKDVSCCSLWERDFAKGV